MEVKEIIKKFSEEILDEIIAIRRHIHKHPELSFKEFETSSYVCSVLDKHGIDYRKGYVETGILGIIKGEKGEGETIALRADMDALPIQEENDVDYCSQNDGTMHACGHDVHTASLLGVAIILNKLKLQFSGKVLLIFQPGEELLPGGAKLMLEEGIFEEHKPKFIIAQHVLPDMESGKVGFKPGLYMASTDEIYITIQGKGGHAAMPRSFTDNVLIASHVIVALQQITSRNADPGIPTVLSFGRVEANGATNVIPGEVKIAGTFRTMDEEWRAEAHHRIKEIATSVARGMGGSCTIKIKKGYPFLVNHPALTEKAANAAVEILGDENVLPLDIRMTAEDFAYFSQQYPSMMYRLGVMKKGEKEIHGLHTSRFDVDEHALKTGMETMSWIAISLMK